MPPTFLRAASRTKFLGMSMLKLHAVFVTVLMVAVLVPAAFATFPGQNGYIAYPAYDTNRTYPISEIFLSGARQLTSSAATQQYGGDGTFGFAWSPSGTQLAFVRINNSEIVSIQVINQDGTGLHQVFSFGTSWEIYSLSWTPDGQKISFFVYAYPDPSPATGIWTVNADGTNPTEIEQAFLPYGQTTLLSPFLTSYHQAVWLEWSSTNQLAFTCSFRSQSNGPPAIDLCLLDGNKGTTRQLPINFPDLTEGDRALLSHPGSFDWSPDGTKILLTAFPGASPAPQLFTINVDGTGLTQLTNTGVDDCPHTGYSSPRFSPDGQSIIASASYFQLGPGGLPGQVVCQLVNLNTPVNPYQLNLNLELVLLNAQGGPGSVLAGGPYLLTAYENVDWQPIPQGLTVQYNDGHGDPLKGMKVELRAIDGTVLDDKPINTAGGTYVFENGGSYVGDFIIRATLTDNSAPPPSQPVFDIRYTGSPVEPVWIEHKIAVPATQPLPTFVRSFSSDSFELSNYGPRYPADPLTDLDSMAAIYFRTRQYVDWTKARLPISDVPTVSLYTFATTDPDGNANADPLKLDAYYSSATSKIVVSPAYSDYSDRDGVGNDDGPFVEWHEFTHHLYHMINNRSLCLSGYTPHLGYDNPDTCDSLDEGFADFLPTYAAREMQVQTSLTVGDSGLQYSSSSLVDSRWDLEWPVWAWTSFGTDKQGRNIGSEEYALAEVLWDLTAITGNTQTTAVIGADGAPHAVTLTNNAPQISLDKLWTQMSSLSTGTIAELRKSFGAPALSIDLDGDGVPDVAPIDVPFLMKGFYPIDNDQQLTASHTVTFYDVGYAQRNGLGARNGAVGMTSHYIYNASNTTVIGQRIPRSDVPKVPNANVALTVLDASGAPLSGATALLTISFSGKQTNIIRRLDSGSGALVYLALPLYFNYLLADGAPLPACDPTHDLAVTVSITVVAQGQTATTTPTFDNCTYWHAIAAATGPAALSFTVTVPVVGNSGDTTPPTTTVVESPLPNPAGWNNTNVSVMLNATDNSGGSGVKEVTYSAIGAQTIPSAMVTGATANFTLSTEGVTTLTFSSTDNANNAENPNQLVVSIDKTAPSVNCGSPDGQWHAIDVTINCTATDAISGLMDPSESMFALTTTVPSGTETANATTGSRAVCDLAGNCANAGPIGGNMVDKNPPVINISAPASATYLLNQVVTASYNCTDGGSGVASCSGPVSNGANINTASVGSNTFSVNATDKVGNVAPAQARNYTVGYKICTLYDPTRSVQSGSTVPIKLQLCDVNGVDASIAATVVHATSLVQTSTNASEAIQDSGNANPDNDFRFDSTLGPTGGYIFNLSTNGLSTGIYALGFTAGADPATHSVFFQVR